MKAVVVICLFAAVICIGLHCKPVISGSPLKYELGSAYEYTYTTDVLLNEPGVEKTSRPKQDVGITVSATIVVAPIWQQDSNQLFKLTVKQATLKSVSRKDIQSTLKTLTKYPILFNWNSGKVGQVYSAEKDTIVSVNLKKGLIGLFQVQERDGEISEIDICGDAKVSYKEDGEKIIKIKTGCDNLEIAGQYTNINPTLEVSIKSDIKTVYDLAGGDIIKMATTEERHTNQLNVRSSVASYVTVRQSLTHTKTSAGKDGVAGATLDDALQVVSKMSKLSLTSSLLASDIINQKCTQNCGVSKLQTIVAKYRDDLKGESMAQVRASNAFIELLRTFRSTSKDNILAVLKDPENADIVPQIIDLTVAAQTPSSQDALMSFIDFDDDTSPLPERYLLSIAYATHPSEKLMKDLLGLLKKERDNEKLKQSISLAAASVLNTYCRDQDKCKTKAAQNMKNTILDKLKNCKEDPCTLMYIRALGNAGLVETLPLLIDTAENSKSFAISYAAVNSMRRIDKKHITPEIEKTLKRIFNQNKRNYDTTVRAEALQLLLTLKPTTHFLRNVILTASDQTEHEFSTYIVAAINDVMKTDAQIRAQVLSILKDPKLYHYGLMAQRGDSTLIKGFMTKTTDNHVMYAISVQSAKSGVMRRSSLQVTSFGDHQILPITTFHIFAQGLESLTGKADEEGGEEQEVLDPSAGMQLDMLDVSLPPVTFFTGSGELMSAVWNAPTEPVTALQATIMLHDRVHRIHLQNGLIVELNIQGVVSMDLSGAISISLWNRYAKSVITNSGALTIKGTTTIATPMFTTESNYHLSGASQIDFRSDVNFYESPFKACLDMSHPPFILKHSFTKYEYLKGTKKSYKSTVNRNRTVHPQSFLIHPKVSAMCRELITDEE